MIEAVLNYSFLQKAIMSAFMASIICGIVGTIIIEKKLVMMSGGIAHASFGGIGLGYYLNVEPIYGALFFSVISAITVAKLQKKTETDADVLTGIFWALGMALGVLFISFTPGYPPDISSYLFGDILTVTYHDLYLIIILNLIIAFVVIAYFNYWKAYLFDDEFIAVIGIKKMIMDYLLYIMIAFSVIILIRVVGIVLVIALLTIPAAISKFYTYSLAKIMYYASLLGLLFSLTGIWVSYQFNIASGAAIILIAGSTYLLLAFIKHRRI